MKQFRKETKLAGILFLIAMVASLVGGGLIETAKGSSRNSFFIIGIILEIINAVSVLGIGIFLFPVLKSYRKSASITYLGLRILEALACLAAPLVLLAFSNGTEIRTLFTGKLIPLFFCGSALVLYSVIFLNRMLSRFISVWGFIGVAGIIVLNVTNIETSAGMLLALPIVLNEIFLGIWMIAKGFNKY